MRKVFGAALNIFAGFLFYIVNLLGFVNGQTIGAKWAIMVVFAVPAFLALGCGLALGRFRNWKRDVGIVFLCASGVTAFLMFTFACLLLTDDFRKLVRPDTLTFFSDYVTGIAVIVAYASLGWLLLRMSRRYEDKWGQA